MASKLSLEESRKTKPYPDTESLFAKKTAPGWVYQSSFLLDSIPDAVLSMDQDFRLKGWNKRAQELYEFLPEEVLDQPAERALVHQFLTDSREIARQKLRLEGKWKGEVLLQKKDGRKLYLESNCSSIADPAGETVGYIAVYRDITERTSNTERVFRSFMENTPTLTWILDDRGCFRYMNSFYKKTFGLTEDAIGRSIYEFYPAEFCNSYIKENQAVWESNAPKELMEKGLAADGNEVSLHVFKFPLGMENGVRLIGGTALDITQMIRTREELVRSNERYTYAGKATSDAIWDWIVAENRIYRGEGFRSLFGYQEDVSCFDLDHIHPGDRKRVKLSLDKALNGTDEHWQEEYRFQCMDGAYRRILDKAHILRGQDLKAIRMIGAMHDVTEQRNLEKMLVAEEVRKKREIVKAIMEAQEKERREISSELHDNVNQILTTCKLFLEIARNNPADTRFIEGCYVNIQAVIQEIRNISHNLTPYTLKDLGLFAAIHDIVEKINQSGKLVIRLFSFQEAEEDKISPDIKLALFRIIQEKISNVLKHSRATELRIEIRLSEQQIHLLLVDNGRGFDEKAVKKGLGLNNIRNRVEYYKGSILLRTAPGAGCEIRIEMPFA
jgi:PAS domain S-box-containing protein